MMTKVCPRCGLATCGVLLAGMVATVQTANFAKHPLDPKERGVKFPAAAVSAVSSTSSVASMVTLPTMGGPPIVRPPVPKPGQAEQT